MSNHPVNDVAHSELNTDSLDGNYRPFPGFDDFAANADGVNVPRWERVTGRLNGLQTDKHDVLQRAYDVAMRAAAVDTGAIEGLYETDRGFTFSIAHGMTALEAVESQRGERVRSYIEAQIRAYEYILDVATNTVPLTSMWLRQLHEVICAGQDTYDVHTAAGPQKHPLERGAFKTHANHVLSRSGKVHAYAPVLAVAPEIDRMIREIDSQSFRDAFPTVQAADVHYALVLIHPFADGNGRVSRALASIYTYRSARVPVLILAAHRAQYFHALEAADSGDYATFARFVFSRTVDAVELVSDELELATLPDPKEEIARIGRLYASNRGWSHKEIDEGGKALARRFLHHVGEQIENVDTPQFTITVRPGSSLLAAEDAYRGTEPPATAHVAIEARTTAPAKVTLTYTWLVLIPKGGSSEEEYVLWCNQINKAIRLPMDDVLSGNETMSEMRLEMLARRSVITISTEVRNAAEAILRKFGY